MTHPARRRAPAVLVAGGVVALALVLVPLGYLVVRATERGWAGAWSTVWRSRTLELVLGSLGLAGAVTAACTVVGVAGAWLVTRTDLPGRGLLTVALSVPLAVPSYLAAWAWVGAWPGLRDWRGAFVVLVGVSTPYVFLPVRAALRGADPAIEEAARLLGRGPTATFLAVTLRQVRIAALGGALLVGLYVLSDFGAVSVTNRPVLTQAIYQSYRGSFDRTPAAALGCVLVVLALTAVAGARAVEGRTPVGRIGAGATRAAPPVRLGRWRWPLALGVAGWVVAVLGVPAWQVAASFRQGVSRADWSEYGSALGSTVVVAALAAAATVVVAVPVGVLSARHPGRLARTVTAVAYAGHALPGVVVGLALVFFGVRFAEPLYQRTPLLVGAYVVLFLSLAVGAVHNSVAHAPPALEEVARSLGRTRLRAWLEVTLPIAAPGVGAGAALVFLVVVKELPATLFLRPTGMETLATRLWAHTEGGALAAAAPYAATLVLVGALPALLLGRKRT